MRARWTLKMASDGGKWPIFQTSCSVDNAPIVFHYRSSPGAEPARDGAMRTIRVGALLFPSTDSESSRVEIAFSRAPSRAICLCGSPRSSCSSISRPLRRSASLSQSLCLAAPPGQTRYRVPSQFRRPFAQLHIRSRRQQADQIRSTSTFSTKRPRKHAKRAG